MADLLTTIVRSKTKEVLIHPDAPTVIIGERCNALGYKSVREAANQGNFSLIAERAVAQVQAGADIINVNMVGLDIPEVEALPKAVAAILSAVDVPLSLDFGDPEALEAALPLIEGKALLNSVNAETSKLTRVLPIMQKYRTAAIGLLCGDAGIPSTIEGRVSCARTILTQAATLGIPAADFIFDCVCLGVATDETAGPVAFATLQAVRQEFGVSALLGASNASHGLPRRRTLDAAYLAAAIVSGMNCVITDPTLPALKWSVLSADAVAGRDLYGVRYIQAHRAEESVA